MNGGPFDCFQCADNESPTGYLISALRAYELLKDPIWLEHIRAVVANFATWVYSYNYAFPAGSTFRRLDMQTLGAAMANAQNRTAVPGL
jgi:hypothetical protein